jgi:murein DD-endopeptidase MepM/ murein hydrolase activator NlpD
VFSETLGAWRIHTGIDICTDEGADVYAAAGGEVTKIYSDNLLGLSVEITHSGTVKTVYSNLADDGSITVSVGDRVSKGDKIGTVGDTSISELAEEAHLHFEMLVNDSSVNPLDYITEESKKASLGMN